MKKNNQWLKRTSLFVALLLLFTSIALHLKGRKAAYTQGDYIKISDMISFTDPKISDDGSVVVFRVVGKVPFVHATSDGTEKSYVNIHEIARYDRESNHFSLIYRYGKANAGGWNTSKFDKFCLSSDGNAVAVQVNDKVLGEKYGQYSSLYRCNAQLNAVALISKDHDGRPLKMNCSNPYYTSSDDVIFQGFRKEAQGGNNVIYIYESEKDKTSVITRGIITAVSENGRYLCYLRPAPAGEEKYFIYDTKSRKETEYTFPAIDSIQVGLSIYHVQISNTGRYIAFAWGGRSGQRQVYLVDRENNSVKLVSTTDKLKGTVESGYYAIRSTGDLSKIFFDTAVGIELVSNDGLDEYSDPSNILLHEYANGSMKEIALFQSGEGSRETTINSQFGVSSNGNYIVYSNKLGVFIRDMKKNQNFQIPINVAEILDL